MVEEQLILPLRTVRIGTVQQDWNSATGGGSVSISDEHF